MANDFGRDDQYANPFMGDNVDLTDQIDYGELTMSDDELQRRSEEQELLQKRQSLTTDSDNLDIQKDELKNKAKKIDNQIIGLKNEEKLEKFNQRLQQLADLKKEKVDPNSEVKTRETGESYSENYPEKNEKIESELPAKFESGELKDPMDSSRVLDQIKPAIKKPVQKPISGIDLAETPATENIRYGDEEKEFTGKLDQSLEQENYKELSPREQLLEDFRKMKEARGKELEKARITDALTGFGQALAQYGADMGTAKAGMIGAAPVKRRDLGFKPLDTYKQTLARFDKQRADLEKKQTKMDKLDAEQKRLARQAKQDKLNRDYKLAQISKLKSGEGGTFTVDQNDATSDVSRKEQDYLLAKMRARGANVTPEVESSVRILPYSKIADPKQVRDILRKAESRLYREKENRLIGQFGYKKNQDFEKDAENAINKMRGRGIWKKSEEGRLAAEEINDILDDAYNKGGQSLSILGPKIAKGIARESGAMTENDVTRYIKNPALAKSVWQTFLKLSEGKLDKDSYQNVRRLMNISRNKSDEWRERVIDETTREFAKREDLKYSDARYYIDAYYNKKPTEKIKYDDEIKKTNLGKLNTEGTTRQQKQPAPYQDKHNKDDLFERNGKMYKWNATKGKYQLAK